VRYGLDGEQESGGYRRSTGSLEHFLVIPF
jgi:hypothetical protein